MCKLFQAFKALGGFGGDQGAGGFAAGRGEQRDGFLAAAEDHQDFRRLELGDAVENHAARGIKAGNHEVGFEGVGRLFESLGRSRVALEAAEQVPTVKGGVGADLGGQVVRRQVAERDLAVIAAGG